jgi:hypothetical protein
MHTLQHFQNDMPWCLRTVQVLLAFRGQARQSSVRVGARERYRSINKGRWSSGTVLRYSKLRDRVYLRGLHTAGAARAGGVQAAKSAEACTQDQHGQAGLKPSRS